jgi:hypothetical protein
MTKFFLAELFSEKPILPFLTDFFPSLRQPKDAFFTYSENKFEFKNIDVVTDISDCDFILIPQGVRTYEGEEKEYVDSYIERGKSAGKKVVLSLAGDLHHDIFIADAIVLKGYSYGRSKRSNEIATPIYVEDLKDKTGSIDIRKKDHNKPVVGFCGWAGFPTLFRHLIYIVRNLQIDMKKIVFADASLEVYKKGVYFRRQAIQALDSSPLIETNFKIRKAYFADDKSLKGSPQKARSEFIDNILMSDFVICPKGDANASARLYEVMTLSRIAVLIDTDMVLPLEEVIDYSSCLIRVPYMDIKKLPEIISRRYESMSEEEFEEMQVSAREAYDRYLRYDVFFNYVFERLPLLNQGYTVENFLRIESL